MSRCTREIGPRKPTETTDAVPEGDGVTDTDSGRIMATPEPEVMEPETVGTDAPRTEATPEDTVAATRALGGACLAKIPGAGLRSGF